MAALVAAHSFTPRYASVKRFVRKLHGFYAPEACAVIETPPGDEAQVDYGSGPSVGRFWVSPEVFMSLRSLLRPV